MNQIDVWEARCADEAANTQASVALQREGDRVRHESEMRRIETERRDRQRERKHVAMWEGWLNTAFSEVRKLESELAKLKCQQPAIEHAAVQSSMRRDALHEALNQHLRTLPGGSHSTLLDAALELHLGVASLDPHFVSQTKGLAQGRVDLLIQPNTGSAEK
jgi:hypothetical protein